MNEKTRNSRKFKLNGEVVTVEILGREIGYKVFTRLVSLASFIIGSLLVAALILIPYYYGAPNYEFYGYASLFLCFFVLPILDKYIKSRFKPLSFTEERKLNQPYNSPA